MQREKKETTLLQILKLPHKMRRTLIPPGIIMQIQLMIILRIPPPARLQNLRRNGPLLLPPLLLGLAGHEFGLGFLLGGVVEDGAAVLGSGVHALAVRGGGVVHFVEEFEEGGVGEGGGVEGHLEGFGVLGVWSAHLLFPSIMYVCMQRIIRAITESGK